MPLVSRAPKKVKCPACIRIRINAPLFLDVCAAFGYTPASRSGAAAAAATGSAGAAASLGSASADARYWIGPPRVDSTVTIEYYWKHENHERGTLADLAKQRNCRPVRQWIEDQVQDGRSLKEIMRSVRMTLEDLQRLSLPTTTTIDASIRIRYNDIYNVVRRLKVEQARKHADGWQSCELWAAALVQEGWDACFINSRDLSATAEPIWALFLLPKAGQEMLTEQTSRVWCLDSTHNTGYGMDKQQKIFLTTIIVRSLATGTGFPAAFLITPSETQLPLTAFLSWLAARVPTPANIIIDCSTTEQAAIENAYREQTDGPGILLCQGHVMRAWEDNIKEKVRVLSLDEDAREKSRALQIACRANLREMVYAEDEEKFELLFGWFEKEWGTQFPAFFAYFRREWIVKRRPSLWSMAFRKLNYLGLIRKQRVDHVVFVLAREVMPDYTRRLVQCQIASSSSLASVAQHHATMEAEQLRRKSDLVEDALQECYRLSTLLIQLQRSTSSAGDASRAELQQIVSDIVSARRGVQALL
ncbi:hypothetical protein OC834_007395 [Tilletia horrida]|nr:hypothetical protein OC834_007395 [Tilletia horrida]